MSISAIGNPLNQISNLSSQLQNSQFRQLGQDLTAGNLSAAQSDFASLQQAFAQIPAASSSSSSDPVAQAFQQLSSDLRSGNLSAAKQDYSTIEQQASDQAARRHIHLQRHVFNDADQSAQLQQLNQLGQELTSAASQAGNLSAVQQAYAAPMQAFGSGSETTETGADLQVLA